MRDEIIQTDGDPLAIPLKPTTDQNSMVPFLSNTSTLKQNGKEEMKPVKNGSNVFYQVKQ